MKRLLFATSLLLASAVCFGQTPSPEDVRNISNYFYNEGYAYLNPGHPTCDIKKIGVYFPDPSTNSNNFSVGVTYKDVFDQTFTCFYVFAYENGIFTRMNWECHSPDVKCFKFCDEILSELMKQYEKNHKNDPSRSTLGEIQQKIADMFRESIENITCSQYVQGFLILDYLTK